jgi:hypothetical protein
MPEGESPLIHSTCSLHTATRSLLGPRSLAYQRKPCFNRWGQWTLGDCPQCPRHQTSIPSFRNRSLGSNDDDMARTCYIIYISHQQTRASKLDAADLRRRLGSCVGLTSLTNEDPHSAIMIARPWHVGTPFSSLLPPSLSHPPTISEKAPDQGHATAPVSAFSRETVLRRMLELHGDNRELQPFGAVGPVHLRYVTRRGGTEWRAWRTTYTYPWC